MFNTIISKNTFNFVNMEFKEYCKGQNDNEGGPDK
jgi:hypothetical protein